MKRSWAHSLWQSPPTEGALVFLPGGAPVIATAVLKHNVYSRNKVNHFPNVGGDWQLQTFICVRVVFRVRFIVPDEGKIKQNSCMKQHLWLLFRLQPKLSGSQWITLEVTVPECHLQQTCRKEKSICYATRYSIIVYVSRRARVKSEGGAAFRTEGRWTQTLFIPHQMSKHNDEPRLAEVKEIRPFRAPRIYFQPRYTYRWD